MKNFLPAVAGVLAIAFAQPVNAQTPCDIKGIRTDPGLGTTSTAVNAEYPARKNTFNWYYGQQYNGQWWNLNNVAINESAIFMPYWQTDNAQITHIQGKPDLPKDGWELIKRDLGYDDAGAPVVGQRNPYVIMYNKRTGMLRVFAAIGDLFNSYQFAEIKLFFNTNGASRKAATLNRMEGIGTALLDTPPGATQNFVSIAQFLNQKSKWFMADFPMEYDPCACQFDSKLKIEINLISQSDVRLTGVTTGTIVTSDVNNPPATQTSTDFDQAFNLAKKIGNNLSAGQKTYKSLDSWAAGVKKTFDIVGTKSSATDAAKKKNAIDNLKAAMSTSNFLKNGLSALPYIGYAVSTFDAFFGGGKEESSPQPVALQPMTVDMTTQTTGTISATNLYTNPTFNTPGTRTITTALEYPYYNEAMGVFSLLTRPVIEYRNTIFTDVNGVSSRRYEFKVLNPLQYVINPASGLEVQDFQVALLQNTNSDFPNSLPNGWEYEGMAAQPIPAGTTTAPIPKHVIRTPYGNSGCLTNGTFLLETKDPRYQTTSEVTLSPSNSTTFLKFILNMRRPGASASEQNTLIVLKYPVTTRLVTNFTTTSAQPCVAVQPQATTSVVQSLCAGSVYRAATVLARPSKSSIVTTSSAPIRAFQDFIVYPNPAADEAVASFTSEQQGQVLVYLTDLVGRRVKIIADEQVPSGSHRYKFSTSDLRAGLYLCIAECADGGRSSIRLAIAR